MAMSDWLSSLRLRMGSSWQAPPKRRRRRLHCSVPAIVEALETRTLLSAVAVNDQFSIDNTGAAVQLDVLANDWSDVGAPLHIVSVGSASHGSATVVYGDGSGSGSGSGSSGDPTIQDQLRYTPLSGFYGTDTLTYTVSDGFGNSQTATVTIQVSDPSGGGSGSGSGSAGGTASASGSASGSGSGSASGSGSGSAGGSSSGTGGTSGSGSGSSGTSGSGSGSSSGTGSGSTSGSGAAAVYTLNDGFVVDPLATFVWTGGDVNTTDPTTETTTETWTDEEGVTYTAVTTTTSTLTITATVGADGNWTYDETLVSRYTTETTAAGVTGSITATGTFDYAFHAFSSSAVYSFTFNADGEDNLSGNLTDTWSATDDSGVLEEGTSTLVWVAASQFAVVIQSTTQRSNGSIAGSSSGSGTASSSSSSTLNVTRTSGAGSGSSSGSGSASGSSSGSSTTPGWTFTHSSQGTGSSNEIWSYSTTASKSADGTISAGGSASGSASYAADETFTESYDEEKTNGTVSLDSSGTSHASGSDSYLTTFSTVTTVDAAGVETTTGTLTDEVSGTSLVTFSGTDTYAETWQTMTGVVMIDNGDGTFTVDLSNATTTNKQVSGTSSTDLSSTASYSVVSLLTLNADGSAMDELTGSESGTATYTMHDEFTETEIITAPNKTTNRTTGGTADSTGSDTFLSSVALATTIAVDETVTVTGTTGYEQSGTASSDDTLTTSVTVDSTEGSATTHFSQTLTAGAAFGSEYAAASLTAFAADGSVTSDASASSTATYALTEALVESFERTAPGRTTVTSLFAASTTTGTDAYSSAASTTAVEETDGSLAVTGTLSEEHSGSENTIWSSSSTHGDTNSYSSSSSSGSGSGEGSTLETFSGSSLASGTVDSVYDSTTVSTLSADGSVTAATDGSDSVQSSFTASDESTFTRTVQSPDYNESREETLSRTTGGDATILSTVSLVVTTVEVETIDEFGEPTGTEIVTTITGTSNQVQSAATTFTYAADTSLSTQSETDTTTWSMTMTTHAEGGGGSTDSATLLVTYNADGSFHTYAMASGTLGSSGTESWSGTFERTFTDGTLSGSFSGSSQDSGGTSYSTTSNLLTVPGADEEPATTTGTTVEESDGSYQRTWSDEESYTGVMNTSHTGTTTVLFSGTASGHGTQSESLHRETTTEHNADGSKTKNGSQQQESVDDSSRTYSDMTSFTYASTTSSGNGSTTVSVTGNTNSSGTQDRAHTVTVDKTWVDNALTTITTDTLDEAATTQYSETMNGTVTGDSSTSTENSSTSTEFDSSFWQSRSEDTTFEQLTTTVSIVGPGTNSTQTSRSGSRTAEGMSSMGDESDYSSSSWSVSGTVTYTTESSGSDSRAHSEQYQRAETWNDAGGTRTSLRSGSWTQSSDYTNSWWMFDSAGSGPGEGGSSGDGSSDGDSYSFSESESWTNDPHSGGDDGSGSGSGDGGGGSGSGSGGGAAAYNPEFDPLNGSQSGSGSGSGSGDGSGREPPWGYTENQYFAYIDQIIEIAKGNIPRGFVSFATIALAMADPEAWRAFIASYGPEGQRDLEMVQAWNWKVEYVDSLPESTDGYDVDDDTMTIKIARSLSSFRWLNPFTWFSDETEQSPEQMADALAAAIKEAKDLGMPRMLTQTLSHAFQQNASGVPYYAAWAQFGPRLRTFVQEVAKDVGMQAGMMAFGMTISRLDRLADVGKTAARANRRLTFGLDDISRTAFRNPLSSEAKDTLRAAARDLWQARTGRRAIWDKLDVHHRIPLEWSHLFPNADPNRVANLVGMSPTYHTRVNNAWSAWKRGLNGRTPSQAEVLRQAIFIDQQFGHLMRFLP